ncbi:7-carboxy-7-deazaguanine synthase (EC 4.3.99.3), partial [uncultured Gammaproteobacteria bacterium]
PTFDLITPTQLANWILEQQLNVRLQLQLHKILWGDQQGK